MTQITPARPQSRTSRGRARSPKVHARDFFAKTRLFDAPASPASPEGIRKNGFRFEKSHRAVPVDGNGNVRALVKADAANPSGSAVVERYAYDGFGREISAPASSPVNTFRFSTKYAEVETGMNYYGYRFYSADAGRWINRDPIAEKGGWNVYSMVGNDVIDNRDFLGNIDCSKSACIKNADDAFATCGKVLAVEVAVLSAAGIGGCLFATVGYPVCLAAYMSSVVVPFSEAGGVACTASYGALLIGCQACCKP